MCMWLVGLVLDHKREQYQDGSHPKDTRVQQLHLHSAGPCVRGLGVYQSPVIPESAHQNLVRKHPLGHRKHQSESDFHWFKDDYNLWPFDSYLFKIARRLHTVSVFCTLVGRLQEQEDKKKRRKISRHNFLVQASFLLADCFWMISTEIGPPWFNAFKNRECWRRKPYGRNGLWWWLQRHVSPLRDNHSV